MKLPKWKKKSKNIVILLVVPVVFVLVISFLLLTNNIILNLSMDNMKSQSNIYADNLIIWADQVISQLNVYKTILEKEGSLNEHTIEMLSASYGVYDGYPFGLYWGDENKNFFDISGWDPGPEFDPTKRGWYAEGLKHTKSFGFGEPYLDMKTGKTAVSVNTKLGCTEVTTVLAADVYFDYIADMMEEIARKDVDRAFLVTNKSRLIVADSDWNMTGKTLDQTIDSKLYRDIASLLDKRFVGMTTVQGNGEYYVNICQINKLDWSLVTCMSKSEMLKELWRIDFYIFGIGVAASAILILLTRRISNIMNVVTQRAQTDPLTNLLNREGFSNEVRSCLKRNSKNGTMLLFDVDNFKKVNDELGHPVGDRFLKELATLMDEYFNCSVNSCARFGGDEFAVYIERSLEEEELVHMLDQFMHLFHQTFDDKYADQNLSVSIGAASDREGLKHTIEEFYKHTDKALYQAKQNGKNQYIIAQM